VFCRGALTEPVADSERTALVSRCLSLCMLRSLKLPNELWCSLYWKYVLQYVLELDWNWGARWSSGQCTRRAIAEANHRAQWPVLGWVTKTLSSRAPPCLEGTLSRWSRMHLQSLAATNPHWARVVGYGPFSLWVIHKEGLCPSSGDNNRLMMMIDLLVCAV
jgi:hypothetical protein